MADKYYQELMTLLRTPEADIPSIVDAVANLIADRFGSDADGILVSFADTYEAKHGEVGELIRQALSECPVTNGAFENYLLTTDDCANCRVMVARVGKKDALRVVVAGNRFLRLRMIRPEKVAIGLSFAQAVCASRARQGGVPRNWWDSLCASIMAFREEGSVLFFAPAEDRKFPTIWAFESRVREWIFAEILPKIPGATVLYLTNGIFAIAGNRNAGLVKAAVGEAYREVSFRDGRFDLRAALLPIPPYFEESLDACSVLCEDAATLLANCKGDEIAVTVYR